MMNNRANADHSLTNPTLESFARASGLTALTAPPSDTYRGWTISQGRWPEPAWMATSPNYDASYEGEEDGWADNGEKADAPTRDALIAEIDAWIIDHCEVCNRHGLVTYAIDDCGPCPECGVPS